MIFRDSDHAIEYIKRSEQTPSWVTNARLYSQRLLALVDGENFTELLIQHIEHLESKEKSIARKKYSRSITDLYERLLRLTDNVYSSTGGAKHYENLSDPDKDALIKHLNTIRGGKSLESWLENTWMNSVFMQDPSGIIYLEYDSLLGIEPTPSYKSINIIRNYESDGQMLKVLLFEPKDLGEGTKQWTLIDDEINYTINQRGNSFTVVEDETFEHQFGMVPALVNSPIEHIGYRNEKLSPIDKVVELTEEYARDLSVKTIYKKQAGFPRRWSYASTAGTPCPSCHGIEQTGEEVCGTCNGSQMQASADVTGEDVFETPEQGDVLITPGSGYVSPDLSFLADARIELKGLEDQAAYTLWGAVINTEAVATATEIVINTQPITARLNVFADQAEYMEMMLTEMIANNMFLSKPKDERVASISYGRNYIIESSDAMLNRYQAAKTAGDNSTVLDRLFGEFLLSKYKSDPLGLKQAIIKSDVEYYQHFSAEQVSELMNPKESARKILFNDFWKTVTDFDLSSDVLKEQFNAWFEKIYEEISEDPEEEVTNP